MEKKSKHLSDQEKGEVVSFTKEVKEEVALLPERSVLQAKAFLSAFYKINGSLLLRENQWGLSVHTENKKIAKLIFQETKRIFHCTPRIIVSEKKHFKKPGFTTVTIEILDGAREILSDLGIFNETSGFTGVPDKSILSDQDARRHFLAGAFLAAGSVNSPFTSNYHLEIATSEEGYAMFLVKLMKRFYLEAKVVKRRSQYVVYLKRSEQIADFLRILDASIALIKFENVRIQRDSINSVVRINNCDIANEMRVQEVGSKQNEAIQLIEQRLGLELLEPKLECIARLRLEYPEASLTELSNHYYEVTHQPITKSGINHRMKKLMDISKRFTKEK